MFPMIASVGELRQAKAVLESCQDELRREGIPFRPDVPKGIMIEIPAAAVAADLLAREADFFSIGTNDLIQYTMACDRMNEAVSELYQPLNPSVLRLIRMVIDAAHRQGIPVGMCGEMAGDPRAIPLLLGMGLDEFSMSAGSIPKVKKLLRTISKSKASQLAEAAVQCSTQEDVERLVASVEWDQQL